MKDLYSLNCRWYTCKACEKFYAIPAYLWLEHQQVPCPLLGHDMTYYPNSMAWERLSALYGLLSSLYISMPRAISFAQYEQAAAIIEQLKALE